MDAFVGIDLAFAKRKRLPVALCVWESGVLQPRYAALAETPEPPRGAGNVGPRESFVGLERSRTLSRIDDTAVWSVTCFFVDSRYRHQGLQSRLLDAAISYAGVHGAEVVEAYPVEPCSRSYRFMGLVGLFERAGFVDVTPPGRDRRIMRHALGASAQQAHPADGQKVDTPGSVSGRSRCATR